MRFVVLWTLLLLLSILVLYDMTFPSPKLRKAICILGWVIVGYLAMFLLFLVLEGFE